MSSERGLMQVPYASVGGPTPDAAPPARSSSGWGPVVLMIVLAATLLLGYAGYKIATHFLFPPSPYSVRHAATSAETTVVFPHQIGHLTRIDRGFDTQRAHMATLLPKGFEARLAGYSRAGGLAAVVSAAATPLDARGEAEAMKEFDDAVRKMGARLAPVNAGPMGGQMTCGSLPVESITWTICAYVDRGAFGAILVSDHGQAARTEVLAIRKAVEHRLS
jgi:hypothetical protein